MPGTTAIEAIFRRQPGKRGEGDRLGQHQHRTAQAGREIGTQRELRVDTRSNQSGRRRRRLWAGTFWARVLGSHRRTATIDPSGPLPGPALRTEALAPPFLRSAPTAPSRSIRIRPG
jgi:hypothetical protein